MSVKANRHFPIMTALCAILLLGLLIPMRVALLRMMQARAVRNTPLASESLPANESHA